MRSQSKRIAELESALADCISSLERLDHREGCCCCGEDMEKHSDPMFCGHSPVDAGEYHHGNTLDRAKKILAARGDKKWWH